jgi:hypothetical protein
MATESAPVTTPVATVASVEVPALTAGKDEARIKRNREGLIRLLAQSKPKTLPGGLMNGCKSLNNRERLIGSDILKHLGSESARAGVFSPTGTSGVGTVPVIPPAEMPTLTTKGNGERVKKNREGLIKLLAQARTGVVDVEVVAPAATPKEVTAPLATQTLTIKKNRDGLAKLLAQARHAKSLVVAPTLAATPKEVTAPATVPALTAKEGEE